MPLLKAPCYLPPYIWCRNLAGSGSSKPYVAVPIGHSLLVCREPQFESRWRQKIVTCFLFNEENVLICIQIYQQLYLLIKSIFVSNNCEGKKILLVRTRTRLLLSTFLPLYHGTTAALTNFIKFKLYKFITKIFISLIKPQPRQQ